MTVPPADLSALEAQGILTAPQLAALNDFLIGQNNFSAAPLSGLLAAHDELVACLKALGHHRPIIWFDAGAENKIAASIQIALNILLTLLELPDVPSQAAVDAIESCIAAEFTAKVAAVGPATEGIQAINAQVLHHHIDVHEAVSIYLITFLLLYFVENIF